ncbi:MAG TPA: GntR family transcriptional regulator, partial [Chloroflexota bacterium]|nr:GntR family transcriptional regulator [Chloroflexota bacterium]
MPHGWAKRRHEEQLCRLVRERIITAIHSGRLDTGDRLPTYREVAEEAGVDLRAVARVYRQLEAEGLVEVRGRSGVFVADQEHLGGGVLAETARWMIGVLRGARTRSIRIPEFPDFARRCIGSTEVRCACIESTEDQLSALCQELSDDFGFHTTALLADQL